MSKRVFLCGVALVVVAVGLLLTDHLIEQLCGEPGVTGASVRRIRPGMSLQEVEGILGGPDSSSFAGVLRQLGLVKGPWRRFTIRQEELPLPDPGAEANLPPAHSPAYRPEVRIWRGEKGTATVTFDRPDSSGRVVSARFEPAPQAGNLPRIRSWFGW
jgi:hypothetical protein